MWASKHQPLRLSQPSEQNQAGAYTGVCQKIISWAPKAAPEPVGAAPEV